MSQQRLIIQMAQATDHTGEDPGRAAVRAAKRALNQATIPAPALLDVAEDDILVRINIGIPDPSQVDVARVASWSKVGRTEVVLCEGGLEVRDPETGATQIVATAAAEVFLPRQTAWRLRGQ